MSASELALTHGTGFVGAVLGTCIALAPLKEMIRARKVGSLNGLDTRQLPLLFVNFYIWAVYAVQVGDIWIFLSSSPAAAVCLFNITSAITLLSQEEGAVSQLCKPSDGAFFRRSASRAWHDASREQRCAMVRKLEIQAVTGFLVVSFFSCFLGKWELAGLEFVSELFPVSVREEVLGSLASLAAFVAYCRPMMRLCTYCSRRDASPILLPMVSVIALNNAMWTVYGLSKDNPWVYVPNGAGLCVSIMQVLVRVVFPGPRSDETKDGLEKQAPCKDVESGCDESLLRLSSRQSMYEDYLLWQRDYHKWRHVARSSSVSSTTPPSSVLVLEDALTVPGDVGAEGSQLLPSQTLATAYGIPAELN